MFEQCLASELEWTKANRLKLIPDKIKIILLGGFSDKLGDILPRLDGVDLLLRGQVWNQGVLLDSQMTAMSRTLMYVLEVSSIDYCNALYVGLPLGLFWRLQWTQNVVAKLVVGESKFEHIILIQACLHWLPIASQISLKVLTLIYNTPHSLGPCYLLVCLSLTSFA